MEDSGRPAFPEDLHDEKVLISIGIHAGPAAEAERSLAPLRELATPLLDMSGTAPNLDIQSTFDEVFPAGGRYYVKSHFMEAFSEEATATLLEWDGRGAKHGPLIAIRTMGGAVARVGPEESA